MLNSYKPRDHQKPAECVHFANEDIGIPPTYSSRKKKAGHADPRFKRLINVDFRRDAGGEVDKFGSVQKVAQHALDNQINEDKALGDKVLSFLKTPNDPSFYNEGSLKKFGGETEQQDLSDEVTKDPGFKAVGSRGNLKTENFKQLEKRKSDFTANLKRSASDCTLNKKRNYIDERDELCEKIRAYPSATSLSKVQNWMRGYSVYPEKRRSVITVIGQTQTKPFSKILSEINQRRKLAKELDKHALCEAIMESAHSQQVPAAKNLVAKVDFVLPDGKVIYSTEKVYLRTENKFADAVYSQKSMEILDINDRRRKRTTMIPQRDTSSGQTGRKSRARRLSKKLVAPPNPDALEEKGDAKTFYRSTTSILFMSLLALISVVICLSTVFYPFKSYHSYSIVDFFRPKTMAWYEKLLF